METLTPKDHAEEVALFRSEVVGALTRLDLPRGELAARLEILSQQRLRPPGATATRTFAVPTLERWYRLYKKGDSWPCAPSLARIEGPLGRSRPSSKSWCATCVAKTRALRPSSLSTRS